MATQVKNSVWFSVMCSREEREIINAAAAKAGINRNKFIRNWIRSLADNG